MGWGLGACGGLLWAAGSQPPIAGAALVIHGWWACIWLVPMPVVVPRGWAAPQEQRGVLPASNTRGGAAVLWGPVPRAQPAALAPWGYATGIMAPRAPSSIPSRASRPISRNYWASWCAPPISYCSPSAAHAQYCTVGATPHGHARSPKGVWPR